MKGDLYVFPTKRWFRFSKPETLGMLTGKEWDDSHDRWIYEFYFPEWEFKLWLSDIEMLEAKKIN